MVVRRGVGRVEEFVFVEDFEGGEGRAKEWLILLGVRLST